MCSAKTDMSTGSLLGPGNEASPLQGGLHALCAPLSAGVSICSVTGFVAGGGELAYFATCEFQRECSAIRMERALCICADLRSRRHAPFPRGPAVYYSALSFAAHAYSRRHALSTSLVLARTNATALTRLVGKAYKENLLATRLRSNKWAEDELRNFKTSRRNSNLSQCLFAQLSMRIFIRDREGACHNNSYGFSLELVRGVQIDAPDSLLHFLAPGYHAFPLKVLRAAPNLLHETIELQEF